MEEPLFNKVEGLILLRKKLWHGCFPMNFVKFLRTSFLQKTSRRLLLYNVLKKDYPLAHLTYKRKLTEICINTKCRGLTH